MQSHSINFTFNALGFNKHKYGAMRSISRGKQWGKTRWLNSEAFISIELRAIAFGGVSMIGKTTKRSTLSPRAISRSPSNPSNHRLAAVWKFQEITPQRCSHEYNSRCGNSVLEQRLLSYRNNSDNSPTSINDYLTRLVAVNTWLSIAHICRECFHLYTSR